MTSKSWVRNLLISIGAYWLSYQPIGLVAWLTGKVTGGIIYGDSVFSAVAMGTMESMGRAVCAALGGAIIVLAANGAKPQRWAFVVALLYVASPPRYHWLRPPTAWDRVYQGAYLLWPAVVCVVVATLIARLRHDSRLATTNQAAEQLS